MTNQEIDAVFERVRNWPHGRQEEAAEALLRMERSGSEPDALSDEDLAALDEALAEADRGEFVPDEEIAALFDKYRG